MAVVLELRFSNRGVRVVRPPASKEATSGEHGLQTSIIAARKLRWKCEIRRAALSSRIVDGRRELRSRLAGKLGLDTAFGKRSSSLFRHQQRRVEAWQTRSDSAAEASRN